MSLISMATSVATALIPPRVKARVNIDGTDIDTVLSLSVSQPYGDHHTMMLRCFAAELQSGLIPTIEEQTSRLLGRLTEVELYNVNNPDDESKLQAKFVITSLSFEQSALGEAVLVLRGYSPTWLMDGAPSYESFSNKSLEDIAAVCAKSMSRLRTVIKSSPTLATPVPYLCRWGESYWNFLKRIAGGSGQWLYFNGKDLIFGKAQKTRPVELIYGHNCYKVSMKMATSGGAPAYRDYDAAAASGLNGNSESGNNNTNTGEGSYAGVGKRKKGDLFGKGNGSDDTSPTIAPPFFPVAKELLDAAAAGDSGAHDTSYYVMNGESTIWNLTAGTLIDVLFAGSGGAVPYAHSGMRVLRVHHELDAGGKYSNKFEAVSDKASMPPAIAYDLPRTHSVLGEVTDNTDPLGQGRVKLRMTGWVQGHSEQGTDWLRVMSADAGGTGAVSENRGQVFIPEVGDQVLVDFLEGNPDKPYVIGSLYHGGNAGGQSNMVRTIMTKSGHSIALDDSGGGTSITITDKSGNTIYLDTQGSNITISAPETLTLNARNVVVNAAENLAMSAGVNATLNAAENVQTSAGENYLLVAKNISEQAVETLVRKAQKISKTAKQIELQSTKGNIEMHSSEKIISNSGDKVKMF